MERFSKKIEMVPKLIQMAIILVEGGGVKTPPILEKLLKFRKASLPASLFFTYLYCQFVFSPQNMEVTRMSEHALMPGLVDAKFDRGGLAAQIYRNLEAGKSRQQETICEYFRKWDLSCNEQKWSTNIAAERIAGSNVYAWVRGQRNDGSEAQMIVVQIGTKEETMMIISHVMAFANYAKDQVYWARDIVFVFVDGADSLEQSALALDAFLQKYYMADAMIAEKYRNSTFSINAEPLKEQCGVLLAGVVYEMSNIKNRRYKVISAQLNGINGQQVNLDVFNGITNIAYNKHGAKMEIFDVMEAEYHADPYRIASRAIYTQAFVAIEGVHSVMGKYGLQGLTVGLSPEMRGAEPGQFIESVCRMMNNALEKLHQSYFMYVLGDHMHFASIAYYMPLMGIILAPLLLSAYYEWRKMEVFEIPPHLLIFHMLGFGYYAITVWIYKNIGREFRVRLAQWPPIGHPNEADAIGCTYQLDLVFLAVTSMPWGVIMFKLMKFSNIASIRILCQLEAALVLGCLSLVNFGLAALSAALLVPIIFVISFESQTGIRAVFRTIVTMVLNPSILYAYFAIHGPSWFDYEPMSDGILDSDAGRVLLVRLIREHVLFGSNHFLIWCVFGFPIWSMLFACAMDTSVEEEEEEEKIKKE